MAETPVEEALLKKARRSKKKLKLRKPVRQSIPLNLEREYLRKFNKIITRMEKIIRARVIKQLPTLVNQNEKKLPTTRLDASPAQKVAKLFISINKSLVGIPDSLKEGAAEDIAKKVNKFNEAQVGNVFKSVLGVDLLGGEPFLKEQLEIFSLANANLIKDVTQELVDKTQQTVLRGLRQGLRHEEIAQQILGRVKTGEGLVSDIRKAKQRAALIARDQVSKLNGQLTELRQTNAGVKKYRWRTVGDGRVRGTPGTPSENLGKDKNHFKREGKIFLWSDPPPDGHPGEPILCRCFAEPVLDDLI